MVVLLGSLPVLVSTGTRQCADGCASCSAFRVGRRGWTAWVRAAGLICLRVVGLSRSGRGGLDTGLDEECIDHHEEQCAVIGSFRVSHVLNDRSVVDDQKGPDEHIEA